MSNYERRAGLQFIVRIVQVNGNDPSGKISLAFRSRSTQPQCSWHGRQVLRPPRRFYVSRKYVSRYCRHTFITALYKSDRTQDWRFAPDRVANMWAEPLGKENLKDILMSHCRGSALISRIARQLRSKAQCRDCPLICHVIYNKEVRETFERCTFNDRDHYANSDDRNKKPRHDDSTLIPYTGNTW